MSARKSDTAGAPPRESRTRRHGAPPASASGESSFDREFNEPARATRDEQDSEEFAAKTEKALRASWEEAALTVKDSLALSFQEPSAPEPDQLSPVLPPIKGENAFCAIDDDIGAGRHIELTDINKHYSITSQGLRYYYCGDNCMGEEVISARQGGCCDKLMGDPTPTEMLAEVDPHGNGLFQHELLDVFTRRAAVQEKLKDKQYAAPEQISWPLNGNQEVKSVQGLNDTFGLAFSGGGARSAAFCLGALRALTGWTVEGSGMPVLDAVDYLSTVSGGGYTGTSFLTHVAAASALDPAQRTKILKEAKLVDQNAPKPVTTSPRVFAVHSMTEQMIKQAPYILTTRRGGRFLCGQILHLLFTILMMALGNILFILAAAFPISELMRLIFGRGYTAMHVCLHESAQSLGYCASHFFTEYLTYEAKVLGAITGGSLGLFLLLRVITSILVSCGIPKDHTNEPRIYIPLPRPISKARLTHSALEGFGNLAYMCFLVMCTVWALLLSICANSVWMSRNYDEYVFLVIATVGVAFAVALIASTPGHNELAMRATYIILLFLPLGILYAYGRICQARMAGEYADGYDGSIWEGSVFIISVIALCVMVFSYSFSTRALHFYYRSRLAETFYAGGRDMKFSELDPRDGPLYICNTTMNDFLRTGIDSESYDFFSIMPRFFGSTRTGYVETKHREDITLSRAMAMSGGAVSITLGRYDAVFGPFRFLLSLISASMNDWVEFPVRRPWKHIVVRFLEFVGLALLFLYFIAPIYLLVGFGVLVAVLVLSFLPMFYGFIYSPFIRSVHQCLSVKYSNVVPPFLYLSDGGHLENLAVYEMLKRRVKTILCFDGGADPDVICDSLFWAMDLARLYLERYSNTRCSFSCLFEDERGEVDVLDTAYAVDFFRYLKTSHGVRIRITYRDMDTNKASYGYLYYIKLLAVHQSGGEETLRVPDQNIAGLNYGPCYEFFHKKNCCQGMCGYPYHSTSLQNLSPELFDTYLQLGAHLTNTVLFRYAPDLHPAEYANRSRAHFSLVPLKVPKQIQEAWEDNVHRHHSKYRPELLMREVKRRDDESVRSRTPSAISQHSAGKPRSPAPARLDPHRAQRKGRDASESEEGDAYSPSRSAATSGSPPRVRYENDRVRAKPKLVEERYRDESPYYYSDYSYSDSTIIGSD